MREIKFRYVFQKGELKPLVQIVSLEDVEFGILEKIPGWNIIAKNQYTGLKDRNGKEIFEGDIVIFSEHYSGDTHKNELIKVIEWEENGYTDMLMIGYLDQPDWCEVIGNIYENPELLKN